MDAEGQLSVVDAAKRLVDRDTLRSGPFRRAAMGALRYEGIPPEVLAFKRSYERRLWEAEFPVYCSELRASWCTFVHFSRGLALHRSEWAVLAAMGLEVGRQLEVDARWRPEWPWLWSFPGLART